MAKRSNMQWINQRWAFDNWTQCVHWNNVFPIGEYENISPFQSNFNQNLLTYTPATDSRHICSNTFWCDREYFWPVRICTVPAHPLERVSCTYVILPEVYSISWKYVWMCNILWNLWMVYFTEIWLGLLKLNALNIKWRINRVIWDVFILNTCFASDTDLFTIFRSGESYPSRLVIISIVNHLKWIVTDWNRFVRHSNELNFTRNHLRSGSIRVQIALTIFRSDKLYKLRLVVIWIARMRTQTILFEYSISPEAMLIIKMSIILNWIRF